MPSTRDTPRTSLRVPVSWNGAKNISQPQSLRLPSVEYGLGDVGSSSPATTAATSCSSAKSKVRKPFFSLHPFRTASSNEWGAAQSKGITLPIERLYLDADNASFSVAYANIGLLVLRHLFLLRDRVAVPTGAFEAPGEVALKDLFNNTVGEYASVAEIAAFYIVLNV